jgi:hypothetical protein
VTVGGKKLSEGSGFQHMAESGVKLEAPERGVQCHERERGRTAA